MHTKEKCYTHIKEVLIYELTEEVNHCSPFVFYSRALCVFMCVKVGGCL